MRCAPCTKRRAAASIIWAGLRSTACIRRTAVFCRPNRSLPLPIWTAVCWPSSRTSTLSIAKTAQPAPGETLRYYYHENVYRPSAESHTFKEISQMGLEMLGAVGEAQVQQAVCLAARSLDALGAEWVLEVSHMGYLFGLFDALGVPDAARAKLLEKLREKNAHELRAAAGAAGLADAADTLCSVLDLSGAYAETLEKAAALCKNDAMRAAVAELEALAVPLEKAGGVIRLDMTLAGEIGILQRPCVSGLPESPAPPPAQAAATTC